MSRVHWHNLTPEIDAFYQKHWDEDILLGMIMIHIVYKNGDKINVGKLSEKLVLLSGSPL